MSSSTENWSGRIALMVAHCAGMVDLVALPVWVGALIAEYKFDPPQAGGLVTLFLIGAVVSSLTFAPRFNSIRGRLAAPIGFALATVAFAAASLTSSYGVLAAAHLIAGVSAGCALSFVHGTIGRSGNPHRLFATVNLALGVFAIIFLGATPNLIAAFGGVALFRVFAGVMLVAAIVSAIWFPTVAQRAVDPALHIERFSSSVWCGIVGISCMALTQAMTFSFLERIGIDRGFGREAVTGVLIALGFVNLAPAPLAALLEKRLSPRLVLMVGPVLQAVLAILLSTGTAFPLYVIPALLFVGVMMFTHTFAFGLLARLDPSARALAGTPAMLMVGAAIGPILGGVLVSTFGYPAIGIAAVVIACIAVSLFTRVSAPDGATVRAGTSEASA